MLNEMDEMELLASVNPEPDVTGNPWADEVAAWPDGGGWLHHRELTDAGPALCRTENLVPHHEGLRIDGPPILEAGHGVHIGYPLDERLAVQRLKQP